LTVTGNHPVANIIIDRLKDVHICLNSFVASPVDALDSTLKGINFQCRELDTIKRAFDSATDSLGRRAFYYNGQYSSGKIIHELIRNAPDLLDSSFAASDGFGYREIRDMPLLPSLSTFRPRQANPSFSSRFGFDDEQSVSFDVTSLHAALWAENCNIHIDQMGFVMRGPYGVFLDPDFHQHLFNELGLQTRLAPYLGQGVGSVLRFTHLFRTANDKEIGAWIARNVNLELPNSRNSYRPGVGITVTPTPRLTLSGKYTAKCSFCQERSDDFSLPIKDGWSVGLGITYRFGQGK
jgi:hypothetical protein